MQNKKKVIDEIKEIYQPSTTKVKIKRRKGRKAADPDKEYAPPTGGIKDTEPHPKRAIKALNKGGMNPLPLQQQQPQNHKQIQVNLELDEASETRTSKKICCDHAANTVKELIPKSGHNGSPSQCIT
ncbi:24125_t:CDS:2 [Gigaspora rosea]|nr:24125_t:CDS:2 [Gigaspora rosea]